MEYIREKGTHRTILFDFYHDAEGNIRYFSVAEGLGIASNETLEMLIDQLSRDSEDELRLRLRMEQQDEQGEVRRAEEEKKKMDLLKNSANHKSGIYSEFIFLSLVLF